MDDALRLILQELERLGEENDARASQRNEKLLNITPETGELLAILIRTAKARRILEIGTSNGYSTLWLAEAVQAILGSVVTVEVSAAKAEMARQNIDRAGLSRSVRQEVQDAGEYLRQQPAGQVDLLFLDANRGQYSAWWPWIQSAIAPGGLLVVDNALSHPTEMADFIAQVQGTSGWRSVTIPVGKGEFVALKPLA